MKKLFLFLFMSLLFVACRDDDKGEGYLINLESVKNGIIGVWKPTSAINYYGYGIDGKCCTGFKPDELTEGCYKYQILKENNKYICRGYGLGDVDGTGAFVDATIKVLNEEEFIYVDKTNKEYRFTRVK